MVHEKKTPIKKMDLQVKGFDNKAQVFTAVCANAEPSTFESHQVITAGKSCYMEIWFNQLTTADMNLGLACQEAAVPSLLLATVQGRFRGGVRRW